MRKGILLINLGTPNSPQVGDVRKYLKEFLMDKRVIDIHPFFRFLLVRGLIVPFRGPKSAKLYRQIWDPQTGSPLLYYSNLQRQLLQLEMGEEYVIELGMRYQYPSIELALNKLRAAGVDSLMVIPLFPQYASATSGSVLEEVMRILGHWAVIPPVSLKVDFYDHPSFIKAFATNASSYATHEYDHILFSFHGLPASHLRGCDSTACQGKTPGGCCLPISAQNKNCYAAQCHETARLIAAEMNLTQGRYSVCFQSRLGKQEWIMPYTLTVIQQLAATGKKSVLVICPAFVADCLETLQEIATEYRQEFIAAGGRQLQLVESLNDSPLFIRALREMIEGVPVSPECKLIRV